MTENQDISREEEQAAFEDWLMIKCPSGDATSVQLQWENSDEFYELFNLTRK